MFQEVMGKQAMAAGLGAPQGGPSGTQSQGISALFSSRWLMCFLVSLATDAFSGACHPHDCVHI